MFICVYGMNYSKARLQGTPQYHRESVPTSQVFNAGSLTLGRWETFLRKYLGITQCPLIRVSLEDRFVVMYECT